MTKIDEMIAKNPIIAGITSDVSLNKVIQTDIEVVFVLYGDIMLIDKIVQKLHKSGKIAIVDIDLIDGLGLRESSVDYLINRINVDGILSSKANIVRSARAQGTLAIHRFFMVDSKSLHGLTKQLDISKPDFVDIMPGANAKLINWVKELTDKPIISSGLVSDKEDVMTSLKAGSVAISSTNSNVWTQI